MARRHKARIRVVSLALGCGLALTGCEHSITGSARVATESRDLTGFTGVEVSSGLHVKVTSGAAYSVTVTADDNLLQRIETSVRGDRLIVRPVNDVNLKPRNELLVTVTLPDLTFISVGGGSEVNVSSVHGPHLGIQCRGGCALRVAGTTSAVDVLISGGAELIAEELTAAQLQISAEGGATGSFTATESARGLASGGVSLVVAGRPTVREIVTSSGASVVYR